MAHRTLPNSIVAFSLLFVVAVADTTEQPRKKTNAKPAPVQLSARQPKTEVNAPKTIEISLEIGDEFEIYSERKHEFFSPLTVELFDAKHQPIKSKIRFSKPKVVSLAKELGGGDYYVYHGKNKFVATCAATAKPAYVRVFYSGYSKCGY